MKSAHVYFSTGIYRMISCQAENGSISLLPLFREKNTERIIRLSVTPVVPPCRWKLRGLFINVSANQRQSERSWWLRVPVKKTDEKFSGAHSWQPSADTLIDLTALPLLLQEPVCCPGDWEVMLRFLDPPPPPPPSTQPEVWACALPYLGQPSPCALSCFAPQLLISALNLCLVKSFSSSVYTKISNYLVRLTEAAHSLYALQIAGFYFVINNCRLLTIISSVCYLLQWRGWMDALRGTFIIYI